MRVVHCITGLQGDGAQRVLLRLTEGLQKRGIDNVVVSLSDREPLAEAFEERGVRVRSLGMPPGIRGILALPHLRRLFYALSPDLLQGWMYHANLMVSLAGPFVNRRVPVLWNIRRGTDDVGERKLSTRCVIRANTWLSSRPERIVYCTQQSREQHEAIGFSATHGVVIGNGFELDRFVRSSEVRHRVRERFGVAESEILIGSIGRDDSAKGRPYLIEAFAELVKRVPDSRLMLVGRGMSEANSALRRLLVVSGVASRVVLVGEYSPIAEVYSAIDVLCSSSVAEGFSNVIGEAMCSEVPCVATDVGNARTLLDGIGFVVPPRSAACLAEGLATICSEGREGWRERGARARSRIVRLYSLDGVVDSYATLYREVVSGRGVRTPRSGVLVGELADSTQRPTTVAAQSEGGHGFYP